MDYSYQVPLIEKTFNDLTTKRKALLAACPGAGKTRMSIGIIERFKAKYPNALIMVFAHGQVLLREQWSNVFGDLAKFKCKVIHKGGDLLDVNGYDVLFAIPQTLFNAKHIPHIDLLVIDEAHHYCEAEATKALLARMEPTHQLRLTGTPSGYVGKDDWSINGITVQELLEYGVLTDPIIELAQADYDYTLRSYNNEMSLKQAVKLSQVNTNRTLDNVLHKIVERITGKADQRYGWRSIAYFMKKTMFVCHSQKQATDVAEYFNSLNIGNILSISSINAGIEEVERFKNDPSCLVFIVVNRGTLGFDYDKLTCLVDLSCTLNVNKLFQMLCRVVRMDKDNQKHEKLFLKVSTPELAPLTHFVMSFVVSLSDPLYYFNYKDKYKNESDIPVPEQMLATLGTFKRNRITGQSNSRQFPDLPKVYTFNDIKQISKGSLKTYAYTNFKTVRRMIMAYNKSIDLQQIINVAKTCQTRIEFKTRYKSLYSRLSANNLLDILDFVLPRQKPEIKWTEEKALELAKRYKSKHQFRLAHSRAYKWLKRQDRLHILDGLYNTRWTKDKALMVASQYANRNRLKTHSSGVYEFLKKNNMLREVKFKMIDNRPLTNLKQR